MKKSILSCNEAYESSYDAEEGCYDGYYGQALPGYTGYGENGNKLLLITNPMNDMNMTDMNIFELAKTLL